MGNITAERGSEVSSRLRLNPVQGLDIPDSEEIGNPDFYPLNNNHKTNFYSLENRFFNKTQDCLRAINKCPFTGSPCSARTMMLLILTQFIPYFFSSLLI